MGYGKLAGVWTTALQHQDGLRKVEGQEEDQKVLGEGGRAGAVVKAVAQNRKCWSGSSMEALCANWRDDRDMMMTRHDDSRWWCAMELNVSEEITCNRQNHSFLSNKYTSQALYQTLQTTKWTYWKAARQYNLKFAKTLLQSGFNLLQVWSPAVPKFVFAVLFVYLLFTFWALLFMFYTHFCGSFPLFQFDKFPKHTELL